MPTISVPRTQPEPAQPVLTSIRIARDPAGFSNLRTMHASNERHWLGRLVATLALLGSSACGTEVAGSTAPLRVNGSTTVHPIVAEAAEVLRDESGLTVFVDTQGGSSGGIAFLGEGRSEIGMSSKELRSADRERYPNVDFVEHSIGADAVALVVSADVWDGGVRSLSRSEMQAIFEGRVTHWSALGGPDQRIIYFQKEPGRGTFEVFARWLYGRIEDVPAHSHAEVGGNEETRNKVASTRGALSQLSYSWTDGANVHALAIETDAGETVAPNAHTIANRAYPLSRPLFLLTNGPPSGAAAALIELVLSARGQALVEKHGYLGLDRFARNP